MSVCYHYTLLISFSSCSSNMFLLPRGVLTRITCTYPSVFKLLVSVLSVFYCNASVS